MYTNWYDLIAHPERVQPMWALYAAWFLLLLPSLLGVGIVLARQPGVRGKIFLGVAVFAVVVASGGFYRDYVGYGRLGRLIAEGRYRTAEGCLERFHAGEWVATKVRKTHAFWRVGGYDFEYRSGSGDPGYHAGGSGAPDARSRVRVAFADVEPWGRVILRLETIRGVCPAAPDIVP